VLGASPASPLDVPVASLALAASLTADRGHRRERGHASAGLFLPAQPLLSIPHCAIEANYALA
jgi:hypothetical protein